MRKALFIAVFLAVLATALYYFIYTTSGSKFVTGKIISQFVDGGDIEMDATQGSLGSGLTLENLEVKNIRNLPEGSVLRIQKIYFNITSFQLTNLIVEAENVRLKLPGSEPIVLSGSFKDQNLDVNIHSKGFTVTEVLSYLPDFKNLVPIKGDIADIDLYVTGNYLEPRVRGEFEVERFIYKGFILSQSPLSVDVQLIDLEKEIKIFGTVRFSGGKLQTKRVAITINQGDIRFTGPWNMPNFLFSGKSKVESAKININLKGTLDEPDLTLSSEPPYAREKLMVMLATGKSWASLENASVQGFNSAALTKDFIDYFFFAGKSNKFAEKFGISDFSVTFDQNTKGIAAKTGITESLEVGYGVTQTKVDGQLEQNVTRKLEGEMKVTDSVTVGVEREVTTTQSTGVLEDPAKQDNNKVMIQYKKSF